MLLYFVYLSASLAGMFASTYISQYRYVAVHLCMSVTLVFLSLYFCCLYLFISVWMLPSFFISLCLLPLFDHLCMSVTLVFLSLYVCYPRFFLSLYVCYLRCLPLHVCWPTFLPLHACLSLYFFLHFTFAFMYIRIQNLGIPSAPF